MDTHAFDEWNEQTTNLQNKMTEKHEERRKAMETFIRYSVDEIYDDYKLTDNQLKNEWKKVMEYDCSKNKNSFIGNKLLYHYQFLNLSKTTRKNKKSFYDMLQADDTYNSLWEQAKHRNRAGTVQKRLFQAHQINSGTIAFFKTCNAMYLYKKYNASSVLDFTAGWGGRGLAAVARDIKYTGIDTNTSLRDGYDKLFDKHNNINMIWKSCLEVDLSELDFDFVLTSPPYIDLEVYENMTKFESKENFHKNFMIPMIERCRKYCKGYVAINIAPDMYKDLTEKFGYEKCSIVEDLKEQKNGKIPDNIYIWNNKQ